jgi:hypothetical protein
MNRVEKVLFGWLVLMLVGVAGAAAFVVVRHATRCDRFHLSPAAWRDPRAHRNHMANRLVECHRLDGLSDEELLAQLGRPAERFRYRRGSAVTWMYHAGSHKSFMFPTPQELEVDVSARGVVRRARIRSYGSD